MTVSGQDWSGYQAAAPSTKGLGFTFVKITEGLGYENPRWVSQRDHAKAAGLVWGGYHYPHMANDPIREADYFLAKVTWQPGDLIVLDWEGYDAANKGVPKATQRAYRDAWLKHVKAKMPGHRVGMYANTDYWLHVDQTSNCGDFLWIATAGRPAGSPGITHPWTFHQYSTAGGLDHDVANFPTTAALRAWAAGPTPAPTPQEDPMAGITKQDIFDAVWKTDQVTAPPTDPGVKTNPTWAPQSFLKDIDARLRALQATEAAQSAALSAMAKALAAFDTSIDPTALVAEITAAIKDAVGKVTVHLDTTENS